MNAGIISNPLVKKIMLSGIILSNIFTQSNGSKADVRKIHLQQLNDYYDAKSKMVDIKPGSVLPDFLEAQKKFYNSTLPENVASQIFALEDGFYDVSGTRLKGPQKKNELLFYSFFVATNDAGVKTAHMYRQCNFAYLDDFELQAPKKIYNLNVFEKLKEGRNDISLPRNVSHLSNNAYIFAERKNGEIRIETPSLTCP